MFAFRGTEVTKQVENIEEVEEVELSGLLRSTLCWLWMNVNSKGSKSESASLPATLKLSFASLRFRLMLHSGGVRGVNE